MRSIVNLANTLFAVTNLTQKKHLPKQEHHLIDNAILIPMAYPEEIVRTTDGVYSHLLPFFGFGKPGFVRAGHACMMIIKKGSDTFEYFDFGRYVSPTGLARARGANTDPDTKVDVKAIWKGDQIENIEEVLQWLYDHPEKTRGEGKLYASLCMQANYESVKAYIDLIQGYGVIPYGPFVKEGSNCARFVTDALLNGILNPEILQRVKGLYHITPSVLGNVEAANSFDYHYEISDNQVVKSTKELYSIQQSCLRDHGKGYDHVIDTQVGKQFPPTEAPGHEDWQWLGGNGYGVWYHLEATEQQHVIRATQYNVNGKRMFSSLYQSTHDLALNKARIHYPSHYQKLTLLIDQQSILVERCLEK